MIQTHLLSERRAWFAPLQHPPASGVGDAGSECQ